MARKAAARKRLAGLRNRNQIRNQQHNNKNNSNNNQTGPLLNSEFENEFDNLSIGENSRNQSIDDNHSTQSIQNNERNDHNQEIASLDVIDPKKILLERAKHLLSRVKEARSKSDSINAFDSRSEVSKFPNQPFFPMTPSDISPNPSRPIPSSITSSNNVMSVSNKKDDLDVYWLLRGVPEVYEENTIVSDELVDQLIQEGGPPPSQLVYPTLYSTNQQIISTLSEVKKIRFSILEFVILSVRCGLRKDGTFLVIHPPIGCVDNSGGHTPITLTLPTPQESLASKQNNILKNYYVGHIMLDMTVLWNVKLTDSLIQEWLNFSSVTGINCLRLEIYSSLTPRSQKQKLQSASQKQSSKKEKFQRRNSAILIGSANIPLNGLFTNSDFTISLSTEISLDQSSQALISDRFNRMPISTKFRTTHLGNSAGTVKCQFSFCDEYGNKLQNKKTGFNEKNQDQQYISSIVTTSNSKNLFKQKIFQTNLHNALEYVPQENIQHSLPHPNIYLCIAIHYVIFFDLNSLYTQLNIPIDNHNNNDNDNDQEIDLICSYKFASPLR